MDTLTGVISNITSIHNGTLTVTATGSANTTTYPSVLPVVIRYVSGLGFLKGRTLNNMIAAFNNMHVIASVVSTQGGVVTVDISPNSTATVSPSAGFQSIITGFQSLFTNGTQPQPPAPAPAPGTGKKLLPGQPPALAGTPFGGGISTPPKSNGYGGAPKAIAGTGTTTFGNNIVGTNPVAVSNSQLPYSAWANFFIDNSAIPNNATVDSLGNIISSTGTIIYTAAAIAALPAGNTLQTLTPGSLCVWKQPAAGQPTGYYLGATWYIHP